MNFEGKFKQSEPLGRTTWRAPRVSEIATAGKCRNCGSKVWRILVSGIELALDGEPLDLRAEILIRAQMAVDPWFGTYAITRASPTFKARFRRTADILAGRQELVLSQHQHSALATAELPNYFPARYTYEIPERPAF